jgi:hypothetical protein
MQRVTDPRCKWANASYALILLLAAPAFAETPTVNLPLELRESNWTNTEREGSCTHATTVMLLRWQMHDELATDWRNTYSGGDWADSTWNSTNHAQKFDDQNIPFAYVTNGDTDFLEWCLSTRRGCGVTVMGGRHAVLLAHLDSEVAILLDNNNVEKFIVVPRERFLSEWQQSHGWAWTPVYSPAPPLPRSSE